jgi:ferredoxin-thioredoxin reductase catalytic chain
VTPPDTLTHDEMESLQGRLERDTEAAGYHLNPDRSFTADLIQGIVENTHRYGYPACPCRLATGTRDEDRDIICPCDYRDADLTEFGSCYCALYVSERIVRGEKQASSIPERRPSAEERQGRERQAAGRGSATLAYPVWRCSVCGYLCARQGPPEVCPICKVSKERFERFM